MIRRIYHLIIDKKIPTLAGCLTFNVVLNGGAFLFLYIILSSEFSISFNDLFINNIKDGKLKDLLIYFFDYHNSLPYSFFLIITSLYSASSLYYHLINVIELLTNIKYRYTLTKRITSIIITLFFLVVVNLITLLLMEVILFLNNFYQYISMLILGLFIGLIVYFINAFGIKTFNFKKIWRGFLFTFFYFAIFTVGFIIYLKLFSDFKIIYGILSFLIILLFYVYALCIGLLIGIHVNFNNIKFLSLLRINKEEVKK